MIGIWNTSKLGYESTNNGFLGNFAIQLYRYNDRPYVSSVRLNGSNQNNHITEYGSITDQSMFIEIPSGGNNIRAAIEKGTTVNASTDAYEDWGTIALGETGNQGYGISTTKYYKSSNILVSPYSYRR